MAVALITGSSGLIGSEAAKFFHDKGFDVVGIDNNLRKYFFGDDASTEWRRDQLKRELVNINLLDVDIRDNAEIDKIFQRYGSQIKVIIHCAAQPSHDWAAKEPITDFTVNALGTINLLEATRKYCQDSPFIFTSTNKVYGDLPNQLPLKELQTRWECIDSHPYSKYGIDESMSIDQSKHSIFGASKVAADVMCQEYGRYFNMPIGIFRGGCLTGPAHSGTKLHGFLSYLVRCQLKGYSYTIYGHGGKQVRDNIHSYDLVNAFWSFYNNPRRGEVYNIGGGISNNCSILEAIGIIEEISGKELCFETTQSPREGDHIWWISDTRKFQSHYPDWTMTKTLKETIGEIVESFT